MPYQNFLYRGKFWTLSRIQPAVSFTPSPTPLFIFLANLFHKSMSLQYIPAQSPDRGIFLSTHNDGRPLRHFMDIIIYSSINHLWEKGMFAKLIPIPQSIWQTFTMAPMQDYVIFLFSALLVLKFP